MALRALHLCSGYGGFELALRSVARVRTVAHVERDAYAAAVLVERMGEARLDPAPVWDDLVTFDGRAWRGRVDLISAGFPCQPFSSAGHQRGVDDDRWLWPDIARIVRDVGPRFVILENVPQLVRLGLPHVLADLADLGFDAEWGLLPASAVGAPHKRERFWLVAHADGTEHSVEDVGDATRIGGASGNRPEARDRWPVAQAADGHAWPPLRGDDDGWRRWIAEGGPQPVLRRRAARAADGLGDHFDIGGARSMPQPVGPPDGLADALHIAGNGLVPQCAAEAIRQLVARAGWRLG